MGQLCHPSLPDFFFLCLFLFPPSNRNPFQAALWPARSSGSQWVHRLFGFPKIVLSPNVVGEIVCAVCKGWPTEANTMSLFLFLSLGPSEVISELCCLRIKTGRDKSWTLEFSSSFCWIQRTKSSPPPWIFLWPSPGYTLKYSSFSQLDRVWGWLLVEILKPYNARCKHRCLWVHRIEDINVPTFLYAWEASVFLFREKERKKKKKTHRPRFAQFPASTFAL